MNSFEVHLILLLYAPLVKVCAKMHRCGNQPFVMFQRALIHKSLYSSSSNSCHMCDYCSLMNVKTTDIIKTKTGTFPTMWVVLCKIWRSGLELCSRRFTQGNLEAALARQDMQLLHHFPDFLPFKRAPENLSSYASGGILISVLNHLDWLLLTRRSSSSISISLLMPKLLILSLRSSWALEIGIVN